MKKKSRFRLFCFFLAFLILAAYLYVSSNRIMEEIAEKQFSSLISSASYNSIDKLVDTEYDYKSLMNIEKNAAGEIQMIVTDSRKVNEFSKKSAVNAYNFLTEKTAEGVDIPVMAFTGIRLISGFGAKIKMKLISVSSVKCEIISEIANAGINQTRHSLYLKIYSTVDIITRTGSKRAKDEISVLVYDNLIVGKVPYAYVNSSVIGSGEEK